MEPESKTPSEQTPATESELPLVRKLHHGLREGRELHGFEWAILGEDGLRAGWAVGLFVSLYYVFRLVAGTLFFSLGWVGDGTIESAPAVIVSESVPLLALIAASGFMALLERKKISDYNLSLRRAARKFLLGGGAGFASLSLLIAILVQGKWMYLSVASTHSRQDVSFGAMWALAFLLVGAVEEGLFRCYPLVTLTRGINFWWALAAQFGACGYLVWQRDGNGVWGVYLAAAAGVLPCFLLHLRRQSDGAFWQAAWITSTVFALYHTANNGENWMGIFAAACIAFVFCVSVRVTGSAWWAIGCHAAWDWAETYFYGTADSGIQGEGHLFAAAPIGNPFWSGGSDGPEGSALVLVAILFLLLLLLVVYGRSQGARPVSAEQRESAAFSA